MKKSVGIATGIGISIIIGVIIFQISETMWEQVSIEEYYEKGGKVAGVVYPDNPQILGPLQINKDKYLLGENVYVILKDLRPEIGILRKNNFTVVISLGGGGGQKTTKPQIRNKRL